MPRGNFIQRSTLTSILTPLLFLATFLEAQPRIAVADSTTINLGTLYEGQTTLRKLAISNSGDSTLHIRRVWTSCGCTVAKLSSDDIAPGVHESLAVSFDTKDLQGPFKREVHIASNDTLHSQLDLKIEGTITPIVLVSPRYILFDRLPLNGFKHKSVEIKNTVSDTIHILSVKSPEPQIHLTLDSTVLPPGGTVNLGVDLHPTHKGKLLDQIEIQTDNKLKPVIKISYIGTVK